MEVGRLVLDALVAGLPYTFNFLGIWLIFRLLGDFDLTVDGSFTLGAAVTATLVTGGWNPVVATAAAALAGATAGLFTAFVHLRLRVILLLAGIISEIGLYSVNLRVMGLPNISFLGHGTIFSFLQAPDPVTSDLRVLGLVALLLVGVAAGLGVFLKTDFGLAMRATGANPQMARSVGINTTYAVLIFLVVSNSLVGFSGSITAQQQYFADLNMGIGVILIGITSILLGELFFRRTGSVWFGIVGVIVGTAIYNIAVSLAVRAGLAPTDLRAFTSLVLLVSLTLGLGLHKGEIWLRLRGRAAPGGPTVPGALAVPVATSDDAAQLVPSAGVKAPGGLANGGRPATFSAGNMTAVASRRGGDGAKSSASLDLRRVNVIYNHGLPNETHALRDLSLAVPAGQFITIIGSNGAGKSTLVSVIAGAILPVSGSISIRGRDISRAREHERARSIARVFQDPLAGTCPEFTLNDNLALAAKRGQRRGLGIAVTRSKRRFFSEYLGEFGLGFEGRLNERVGRLSGGQRQALSILMAVIQTPDVLLLDEHTAALDPRNQALLLDMTAELIRETGCTTLMVTHNMDQAIRYGQRMIMMHRGTVLFDVAGERKQQLTVLKLVEMFQRAGDDAAMTDAMILGE